MTTQKQALGRWGEETAVRYLEQRGYTILARNVHTAHGELDIVARKDGAIIFVEVKARSSNTFGFPEQAVTLRKQAHLVSAAEDYFAQHPESSETWQFDVIAITRSGSTPEIEHFENVIG
ncbi:YraN family protein [bacterium]|nr:YraN family protein [bacterium]